MSAAHGPDRGRGLAPAHRPHLRRPRPQLPLRLGDGVAQDRGPALAPDTLGRIDAVLLSHEHHEDNLDPAGRALLPSAGTVVTTASGARRLGGGARGLQDWQTTTLEGEGRTPIEITATRAATARRSRTRSSAT